MSDFLESRTGLATAWRSASARLMRPLPPGAGLRVTLGVAAAVLLLVQFATGTLLALYYQPTLEGAHESVALINGELRFGWLVRSLHVWGMHLLVLTTLVHGLAEFLRGSNRAPRELLWIVGSILFLAVAAGAFTGQVLPMDQAGYQGLKIAASTAGPLGPVLLGGKDPTDATMSRFFVAHILLIPAAIVLLGVLHVALVAKLRLHGATEEKTGDPTFLERSAIAALVAIGVLAVLAFAWPCGLKPAADLTTSHADARPLWPFLPLYQAKKMGVVEYAVLVGAPAFLVALPFLDRARSRVVIIVVALLILASLIGLGALGARS